MPVCRTNTEDKMVLMLQVKRLVDADMPPLSCLGILPTNFFFQRVNKMGTLAGRCKFWKWQIIGQTICLLLSNGKFFKL